jgi:hypothetical protein
MPQQQQQVEALAHVLVALPRQQQHDR